MLSVGVSTSHMYDVFAIWSFKHAHTCSASINLADPSDLMKMTFKVFFYLKKKKLKSE